MERLTIVQFVGPRGLGHNGGTRDAKPDILMSRITHNNQDVIFQLPTLQSAATAEKYCRQRTHNPNVCTKEASRRCRDTYLWLNNGRNSFTRIPFNTLLVIEEPIKPECMRLYYESDFYTTPMTQSCPLLIDSCYEIDRCSYFTRIHLDFTSLKHQRANRVRLSCQAWCA